MTVDPRLLQEFGAWFNVDLIDLGDQDDLDRAAEACAAYLRRESPESSDVGGHLTAVLDAWSPEIVAQFERATDVDWRFDEETEQTLKEIIARIIEELRGPHGAGTGSTITSR